MRPPGQQGGQEVKNIRTQQLRISRYHADDKREVKSEFLRGPAAAFAKISMIYITHRHIIYIISSTDIDNVNLDKNREITVNKTEGSNYYVHIYKLQCYIPLMVACWFKVDGKSQTN